MNWFVLRLKQKVAGDLVMWRQRLSCGISWTTQLWRSYRLLSVMAFTFLCIHVYPYYLFIFKRSDWSCCCVK
jgi:hypothetical protein